jgi:hypothetical protein
VLAVADYTPVQSLGSAPFTSQASGAIVGGDVVMASGSGTVAAATAGALTGVGVAAHDVAASGIKVAVYPLKCVHETLAGAGGVTAGNPLKVGATAGKLVLWVTGTDSAAALVGIALTTAVADAALRWIGR